MFTSQPSSTNPIINPSSTGSTFGINPSSGNPQNTLFGSTDQSKPFGTSLNTFGTSSNIAGVNSNPFSTAPSSFKNIQNTSTTAPGINQIFPSSSQSSSANTISSTPFSFGNTPLTSNIAPSTTTSFPSSSQFAFGLPQSLSTFPSSTTSTGTGNFPNSSTTSTGFGNSSFSSTVPSTGLSSMPSFISTTGQDTSSFLTPSSAIPSSGSNIGSVNTTAPFTNSSSFSSLNPSATINTGNFKTPSTMSNQPTVTSFFNKTPSTYPFNNGPSNPVFPTQLPSIPNTPQNGGIFPLVENPLSTSFSFSPENKLLLNSSELASNCCKSNPEFYFSTSFPKLYNIIQFEQNSGNSTKGYAYLSKHGVDLSEIELQISRINTSLKTAFHGELSFGVNSKDSSLDDTFVSPIEYQRHLNTSNLSTITRRFRNQKVESIKQYLVESIKSQWASCRLGTFLGPVISPVSVTNINSNNFEIPIQLPSVKTVMNDHKARSYAGIISEFNNFRLSQESSKTSPLAHFPLCNRLISILSPFTHDSIYSGVTDVLRFVAHVSDETGLREKKNFTTVTDEFSSSAKTFFEKEFIIHMDKTINQSLRDAILGGRPNLIDKARAYTNVRLAQRNHSHGSSRALSNVLLDNVEVFHAGDSTSNEPPIYPWATLYFLIRAGATKSHLLSWIEMFESYFVRADKYFKDALIAFSSPLQNFNSNHISLGDFVKNEYLRLTSLKETIDPFRLITYGIISAFVKPTYSKNPDHSLLSTPSLVIISTFEDWIWYNLCIFGDGSLVEFRETVQKFDPSYFDSGVNGGNPSNYFKLLFFIGLFDKALLAMTKLSISKSNIFIEAVHVSIAILYYSKQLPNFNMEIPLHLLRQYITLLTVTYSKMTSFVSLEYLMLLSLIPSEKLPCFNLLVNWILSTSSFKAPIATIGENGTIQPGPISQYLPLVELSENERFSITKGLNIQSTPSLLVCLSWKVANALLSRSISEDEEEAALGLYHICGAYDKIFEILSKKLSEALSEGRAAPSAPSSIARQARGTLLFYHQKAPDRVAFNSPKCQLAILRTNLLLSLFDALTMQNESQPDKVLEVLKSSELFHYSGIDKFSVHEAFSDSGDVYSLNRHLGLLLELTLSAISELYKRSIRSSVIDPKMASQKYSPSISYTTSELKLMARSLMSFAGKTSSKLGPSNFAVLTRLNAILQ